MALEEYRRKRDFSRTPEPSGDPVMERGATPWHELPHGRRFCVQKHRATRMHFDFRLEHDGVLLSWAIPRGPSLDPAKKRLAVQTEDHPVDYGDFEGVIPSGYGTGTVMLWDIGTYEWVRESAEDFDASRRRGDIKFRLQGSKISGEFALVHIGARGGRFGGSPDEEKNWLLIKKRDSSVVPGFEALDLDVSVKSHRSLDEIAADAGGDPRVQRRAAQRSSPAKRPPSAPPDDRPSSPPRNNVQRTPAGPLLPMLATAVDRPFSRDGWLFELKYDGVRAIVTVRGGAVSVRSRHGRDETHRYPELQHAAAAVAGHDCVIDGEICALDAEGRPSFQLLQSRINVDRDTDVRRALREAPVVYFAFDILELDGRSLLDTSLRIRKKTLRDVLRDGHGVAFADHVERDGDAFFAQVQRIGVEGMVAKRADSHYIPGRRSRDWIKVKAWLTQSCVIAGYTAGQGKRSAHLGALILAVMRDGALVHCGQVGTGFDDATLRRLRDALRPLEVPSSAIVPAPRTAAPATWARPELVCEVRHAGWTSGGILRHPAFVGLRPQQTVEDTAPELAQPVGDVLGDGKPGAARDTSDAGRDDSGGGHSASISDDDDTASRAERHRTPKASEQRLRRGGHSASISDDDDNDDDETARALRQLTQLRANDHWEIAGRRLALTNLDKVLWPDDGITKRDMVAYYVRMHRYLLPYLRQRPLSMQVFPDGITGKSFWRKDKPAYAPRWMESWTYHGEKTKEYIVVNEVATLAWVANAGVIDLHPWHSRIDAPDQPDWAVFDLDPFEPATFADVVDIAKLVKAALDFYTLRGVLKTSGQTGLQIYVPLRRGPSYDEVRGWVEEVGRAIGRLEPKRITWEWTVSHRNGKIRIDYTQNIINKTLAAPYSLRPARAAPVSTPIAWEELDDAALRPDRWNISTIAERVAEVGDLFLPVLDATQALPAAHAAQRSRS